MDRITQYINYKLKFINCKNIMIIHPYPRVFETLLVFFEALNTLVMLHQQIIGH